jgi:3-oxoacyl-[acyl-carrier protein] reductase
MSERRVALVTAAAGAGIGAATARRLLSDGFDVVVTDVHERRGNERVEELSQECERPVRFLQLDVSDRDQVGAVVDAVLTDLGRIDVLVNNAGFNKVDPILEMDPSTWDRIIAINLTGAFNCIRAVLPGMVERGSGAIVNVSSAAAWESTTDDGIAYPATKAGLLGLTRAVAAEVGGSGVRVNAVAPGLIYNEFLRRIYPDDFFEKARTQITMGRLGEPADVANLIAFLVSEDASYITGEVYGISGGQSPHA